MDNINNASSQVSVPIPAPVKKKSSGWIINLVIILIVVGIILYLVSTFTTLNVLGLNKSAGSNAWKAVFLTNSQVYFGHTTNESSDPVILEDIYYLQVTQPLQQVGANQNPPNLNQPQLSLVKLGNELHGPEDQMRINREHILYIEDLKEAGRVVEAINAYIAGQEN
jgi:hypothetical protein